MGERHVSSFAGIAIRSRAERAYDRDQAETALAAIEEAQRDFLKLVAVWAAKYDGHREAFGYLDSFLSDFFYERMCDAAEAMGGVNPDEIDDFRPERERVIEALMRGGRP